MSTTEGGLSGIAKHHLAIARAQLHTTQARLCTEHHRLDCRVCGATTTAEETA